MNPQVWPGNPYPLGANWDGEGTNFALFSENATAVDLLIDAYIPDNDSDNRPAFMFIHGGGFVSGDKQNSAITNLADFYSSRGWAFFSISYRLQDACGTTPQSWVDFTSQDPSQSGQANAIYPAQRDAKAAMRWLVANADNYGINTNYITVGGSSAGAITAITVGISEPEDFRDELDSNQDPTLSSTNPDQAYEVQTIVNFWGSNVALDILDEVYGRDRFDLRDPPMIIVHGTEDPTVPYSNAIELRAIYEAHGIPMGYYPIEGGGHGAWNAIVDGKRIEELAFDFITEQQELVVE